MDASNNGNYKEQEFISDVDIDTIESMLKKMEPVLSLINSNQFSVLVHGMGKHPKSTYKEIQESCGEMCGEIKKYPLIPPYLFFLRPLIANYAGLIEVFNLQTLRDIFFKLMENSMVGIYVVSKEQRDELFSLFNAKPHQISFEALQQHSAYFYYVVDADNGESQTGIVEIFSYGFDCPDDLKKLKKSPLIQVKNQDN